jgi:PAS domain S-box-containing protein
LTLPGADAGTQSLEPEVIGQVPWTLTALRIDEETLDLVQANLDARLPVLDLPMQWREAGGRIRHLVVSGEPRNDARGVFLGYWGVVRDVSADVTARQALAATEGRYQDLFEHMPTPLVLHRNGHVIEANPAAQALLLGDASQPMAGMDLLGFYEGGDSRERARRRLEEIEALPIGLALPVTDYRLIARKGRTLSVRATGVRVEATDGAATLSIFVDDTERRVAEDAVRRSETMLSHLVATSPDVITLSELDSGRYVMVNTTFERVTGLAASEVVGHTALELGLWADPTERDVLVARLRQDGAVKDMPLTLARKGAPPVAMRASGARFMMDRREYLVMNARDVSASERDRLEREAILQTASIGIALTRGQQFVIANACLERLCGWPQGTLAGQPARVLWGGDDEQLRAAAAIEARISRGDVVEFETRVQRADGSSFLGRITANPTDPARPAEGGTVWIIEDVTGQRQAEGALARARDEAETANRAKSSFLANTSHELRTPLNGIVGLARLAGNPELDEAVRRQHLSQISESAQSLTGIISDILDLSKIESGKLTLESTTFDLEGLLNSLHGAYAMLAQARGLTLTLQIAPEAAGFVRGDALRVRQIVSNFVSNALKFTEYGGVDLSAVRVDEQTVRIAVRDSGPGIDDATQARLFRPFTQADDSTTRRFGGTGLGLSICRELAILMGGQVGVDSAAGRGSVFWAQLPMPATVGAPESSNDVLPDLGGVHVLLVEDNPVNMMIAVALLEQWGVRVEQAADGAQALAALDHALREGRSFDVVLMDLQMPGMSGYEATRSLRRRPGAQNLPVIALTAAALVTEREEAFKAGMNDFLTKPIDADRLRATLSHWVVRRVEGVNNLAPEQRNS